MATVLQAYLDNRSAKSMPYDGFDCEHTDTWLIETDDATMSPLAIRDSGVLPRRFDPYQGNVFLTCRKMTLTREQKAPKWWRADVYYSSQPLSQKEQAERDQPNPLLREAEIDWDAVAYQVPVMIDLDGHIIASSAGEQPDQPPSDTEYYWQATVVKNVAIIPDWLLQCAGRVNSSPYMIDGLSVLEKHSRLISLRVGRKQQQNGYSYRQLTMGIEFRSKREPRKLDANGTLEDEVDIPDPFELEIPDMGLMRIGSDGNLERILDSNNRPVPTAVPLDGLGDKLDNPTVYNTTLLAYRIRREFDFGLLPLT